MRFGQQKDMGDYVLIDLEDDDVFESDIPEGCRACGGDYPHCVDSCPMFDD